MCRTLLASLFLAFSAHHLALGACPDCIDYGSEPFEPIVGTLDVTDDPVDVQVRGNLVYLLTNNRYSGGDPPVHELIVVDVFDASEPTQIGVLDSPWGEVDLDVEGSYAYVCNPSLARIDVSDPSLPRMVGHFDFAQLPGETAKLLDVEGGFAYVVTDTGGSQEYLRVFDVRGVEPLLRGTVEFPYRINEVIARDSIVYGVGYRLWVVDAGDPDHPEVLTNVILENQASDIGLIGNTALISIHDRQSILFDVSDPSNPQTITRGPLMGRFETADPLVYDVFASAIRVLDLSNPEFPKVLGTAAGVYGFFLDVDGCRVATVNPFLGDELRMIPVHCMAPAIAPDAHSTSTEHSFSFPNPAGVTADLHLSLSGTGRVAVWIHSADGRLLRRIDAESDGGPVSWDGRDERGRRVGPGLYFYRAVSRTSSANGKITLLE